MSVENQKKNLQCGSCTNLVRDKVFETKCADMGKIPSSKGCSSHVPDAYALVQGKTSKLDNLLDIAHVMSSLSPMELQVFAGLMMREKITRKNGFKFLQKIYIRVQGNGSELFLNDFIVGYVLDASKEYVRIIGENGGIAVSAINDAKSLTLYTTERFAVLRSEMMKNKKFINPKGKYSPVLNPYSDTVMPLDSVDDQFLHKKGSKNVKRTPKDDLTSLVSKLGRGILRPRKSATVYDGNSEISINHD